MLRILLSILTLLSLTGCSDFNGMEPCVSGDTNEGEGVTVFIGGVQDATRTSLDQDGQTVHWSVGDRIAVWAHNGQEQVLQGEPFTLYSYNSLFSSADFTATITPMAAGSYTYHAVYPVPSSISGTHVSYNLPTLQSGSYVGAYDIMASAPARGDALDIHPRDERLLAFRHLLHMVRIEIPAGRNLLGQPVKRLEMVFPTDVTGTVSFDCTDPEGTLSLTGGNRKVIIDFDGAGTQGGDAVYAYAFIHPCDLDGEVVFRAYNAAGFASQDIKTTLRKTMAAGRATPIALTIPAPRPIAYLNFKTGTNNLGEDITNLLLTTPQGVSPFIAPFTIAGATQAAIRADADGVCRVGIYPDVTPITSFAGQEWSIDYESANARLSGRTITMPGTADVMMNIPYLFEENFSGVGEAESGDVQDLSGYNLAGWSGSRYSLKANTAARIWSYLGSAAQSDPDKGDNHRGRLDTSPLSNLKEGANVKISASFRVGGTQKKGTLGNCKILYSKYSFGTDTRTGAINGDGIEIAAIVLTEDNIGTDGSYTTLYPRDNIVCTGVTNRHRLSWRTSFRMHDPNWISALTAAYVYVYIDDIKVKITQ